MGTEPADGAPAAPAGLHGREAELGTLAAWVAEVAAGRGSALLVRGGRGSGRSALLREAVAGRRGYCHILRAAGSEGEADMPYAALHTLLRAVRRRAEELPAPQARALEAVFGRSDPAAADPMAVSLGTLGLVETISAERPVLLIVDDADLLDPQTWSVLAFVARRIHTVRVGLLAAVRDAANANGFEDVPELALGPLTDEASRRLLDDTVPGCDPELREVVLREAEGNPFALTAIPSSFDARPAASDELPLSPGLEAVFAPGLRDLPEAARWLLLVVAVNDEPSLTEANAAVAGLLGGPVPARELDLVRDLGLIRIDRETVRFGHRLAASAVRQAASLGERHSAHRALAGVVGPGSDRGVWHTAASTIGRNEELARQLERAAERASVDGDLISASRAVRRAADLSEEPAGRNRRLLRSAELAHDLGRGDLARGELDRIAVADRETAGRVARLRMRFDPVLTVNLDRLRDGLEAARRLGAAGERDEGMTVLVSTVTSAHQAARIEPLEREILATLNDLGADPGTPSALFVRGAAAPFSLGPEVAAMIAGIDPGETDVDSALLLGYAASCVAAAPLARPLLTRAADELRRRGRRNPLARATGLLAHAAIELGEYHAAVTWAREALELSEATGQPMGSAIAATALALAAALQGDQDEALRQAAAAERAALPVGGGLVLARVHYVRAVNALGSGRPAEASDHLFRLFDPADPAHERLVAYRAIGDLAEAATQCGRHAEAAEVLDRVAPSIELAAAPRLTIPLEHARVVLVEGYEPAAAETAGPWPFPEARFRLAVGMRRRRERRVAASREPLRRACETFERIGAEPWAKLASRELSATAESANRGPEMRDELTPQELQVARLAATGLSNREIGQRLALSHRTVGSHLSRVFPKLGVTSRTQISAALESANLG